MKTRALAIIAAVAVALSVAFAPVAAKAGEPAASKATTADPQKDESLRKGETRDTLDPAQFRDPKAQAAYEVAKEIPWVLDSIYCYCRCHENPYFRHISLLSCYVDDHAST